MKFIRYIAFPFVPIYFLITWLRNKLFDLGIKKSVSYDFPIICVGNLSVGGTGKTPMIEYFIRLLKDDSKIATLSRGYGRKTKGFQLANKESNAETIGDEPYQFYHKFKKDIQVVADGNRNNGIQKLRSSDNPPEIILLDDAYQHRNVRAGFYVLLTTYSNPYFNDIVLPTGDLREPRYGANRADVIIVTKSPSNLSEAEKQTFLKAIKPKEHQNVFFSTISYDEYVYSESDTLKLTTLEKFTLVTGIANAKPLVDYLKLNGLEFSHDNFKDHHNFTETDIESLNKASLIITTEKDFMRLKQYETLKHKLFYLPIKVTLDNEVMFNNLIKDFISKQ